MKRISVGLRKVSKPVSPASLQRGCQRLRLDHLFQGPLNGWRVIHHHSKCCRRTQRQQDEGRPGGEERHDGFLPKKPSGFQKSCHCMKC